MLNSIKIISNSYPTHNSALKNTKQPVLASGTDTCEIKFKGKRPKESLDDMLARQSKELDEMHLREFNKMNKYTEMITNIFQICKFHSEQDYIPYDITEFDQMKKDEENCYTALSNEDSNAAEKGYKRLFNRSVATLGTLENSDISPAMKELWCECLLNNIDVSLTAIAKSAKLDSNKEYLVKDAHMLAKTLCKETNRKYFHIAEFETDPKRCVPYTSVEKIIERHSTELQKKQRS